MHVCMGIWWAYDGDVVCLCMHGLMWWWWYWVWLYMRYAESEIMIYFTFLTRQCGQDQALSFDISFHIFLSTFTHTIFLIRCQIIPFLKCNTFTITNTQPTNQHFFHHGLKLHCIDSHKAETANWLYYKNDIDNFDI